MKCFELLVILALYLPVTRSTLSPIVRLENTFGSPGETRGITLDLPGSSIKLTVVCSEGLIRTAALLTFSLVKLFLAIILFLSKSRAFWNDFIASIFLLSMAKAMPRRFRVGMSSGVVSKICLFSSIAFDQSLATAALMASWFKSLVSSFCMLEVNIYFVWRYVNEFWYTKLSCLDTLNGQP